MLLLFSSTILFQPGDATGATYYVKTNGNNGSLGTSWAQAWKTLGYAASNISSGDTVYVTNGRYYETVAIQHDNDIFIGYSDDVILDPGITKNYGFVIQSLSGVRIENFKFTNSRVAQVYLNNSTSCVITNNILHHNYAPANNGSAVRLENVSDGNVISANEIYGIAANVGFNCYGIYLHDSDNNTITSNNIHDSGQAIPIIPFHGIYLLNSDNNIVRYNWVHDMDHYGIHVMVDNSYSGPTTFLDNKILDNTVHGMDYAILTEDNPYIDNCIRGQVIARNKIWKTGKGIIWNAGSGSADGGGGWCYKNVVARASLNDSYLEAFRFPDWPKVYVNYNTARGGYYGIYFQNNGHAIYNNATGYNYSYSFGIGGAQPTWYQYAYYCSAENSGKLDTGSGRLVWSTGCMYADPLFVSEVSNGRLQWNSPLIGVAQPDGTVRGAIGGHPSYLKAADETASSTTSYTLVYVTGMYSGDVIPSTGKIKIEFPTGFSFNSPTAAVVANIDGSLGVSSFGSMIVLTRSGGSQVNANRAFKLRISGVVNPAVVSSNYFCVISTLNSSDEVIEKEESNNFRIIGGANTTISISKSVSNVTLAGVQRSAIPGSTVKYLIEYSNTGSVSADEVVIYDRMEYSMTTFKTAYNGTATSWTLQYSTNTSPSQSYSSADYDNTLPNKEDIKWVRWKKPSVATTEDARTLFFEIIIK
ncbi:MAG: right-handed parallel beta-helix repeat-containing protein [Spirochaetes bacterium]|nr:right-handed parallel beta-helix repeat-containing protein [Spirochaetota bacterium]